MKVATVIERQNKERTREVCLKNTLPELPTHIVATDSIGEVIEKMVILHIRTWMLEDAITEAETDKEIADLKRKIDICFKQKRPKYIEAINAMIDNAIIHGHTLKEDSVKLYGRTKK